MKRSNRFLFGFAYTPEWGEEGAGIAPLSPPLTVTPILPVMPDPVRSPETRERLQTAARAMRRGGATTAEIARALGVPGSTILRWASEGGWRVCDMAGDSPLPVPRGEGQGEGFEPGLEASCVTPSPHPEPPLQGREDALSDLPASLPRGATWTLMARAMELALAGRAREADFNARLAERLARTIRLAGPTPAEEDAEAEELAEEEEVNLEELRAELTRRIHAKAEELIYARTCEEERAAAEQGLGGSDGPPASLRAHPRPEPRLRQDW